MPRQTIEVTPKQIEDAEQVLHTHALTVITQAAADYIRSLLEDDFGCWDEKMLEKAVNEVVDGVQDDIQFHADKVMERGYNEGRIEARAQFLIDDWSRDGREEFGEIVFTVLKRNAFEPTLHNAKNMLETYGWAALDVAAKSLRCRCRKHSNWVFNRNARNCSPQAVLC